MTSAFRRIACFCALLLGFGFSQIATAQAQDLVSMLTSQLGVTEQQATGGAGSILDYAKGQMSAGEFDTLSSSLPGVESLIGSAPATESSALGSGSSLLSGSTPDSGSLGGSAGGLGDVAGVANAFSELGLSPEMVNEFVPVILEYAQSEGGQQAMQLLQGALTGL